MDKMTHVDSWIKVIHGLVELKALASVEDSPIVPPNEENSF